MGIFCEICMAFFHISRLLLRTDHAARVAGVRMSACKGGKAQKEGVLT